MSEPSTPLMRQYTSIKQQHPNALLFFRLGDFYELFFEDAVTAARELQITLTSRNKEKGIAVPMCGVPYHAAQTYVSRLIQKGYRVAICDQTEDPRFAKKLVKREVTRVVTPGTAVDLAQAGEPHYIAAIVTLAGGRPGVEGERIGLALADLSTGEFRVTEFESGERRDSAGDPSRGRPPDGYPSGRRAGLDPAAACAEEISLLGPREVLYPAEHQPSLALLRAAQEDASTSGRRFTSTAVEDWAFAPDYARRLLVQHFSVLTLDGFGLAGRDAAVAAAGGLLHYLRETQHSALKHLDGISFYQQQQWMMLDAVTVRNLELVEPLFPTLVGARQGCESDATLLATLNRTRTPMGARLLKTWLLRPSMDRAEIESRLDAVAELRRETIARGALEHVLSSILDLERLLGKVSLGTASPRDMLGLGRSLEALPALRGTIEPLKDARLARLRETIDPLEDVAGLIARAINPDGPANPADGGVIRPGYNAELDGFRDLSQNSKRYIAQIEARERARTGIGSLKVRFNNVFGYYIEVSRPNAHLVPGDYERKQTLVNAERYTTPELKDHERRVLEAEERILELERVLFAEVRSQVAEQGPRIRRTAAALAELDVLRNFAAVAAEHNYTRPQFCDSGEIQVVGGRHPVIERLAETLAGTRQGLDPGPDGYASGERFVPNDLYLNPESDLILILTGPNMGGKSTYLRQAALISILGQAGCFVPAESARLAIVDRIFTRIGASDNLARGRSTFMMEMTETAAILNTATRQSLILLDEIGRGTATFDGLAIAWAVVEYIHKRIQAKTLFATHYHELTELAEHLTAVKNYHVSVKESGDDIVFLRRVEKGAADRSYGIEVARLAGLPARVVERSREVLALHERSEEQVTETLTPGSRPAPVQLTIFTPLNQDIVRAISEANLDELRPLDALNLLAQLKKQIT